MDFLAYSKIRAACWQDIGPHIDTPDRETLRHLRVKLEGGRRGDIRHEAIEAKWFVEATGYLTPRELAAAILLANVSNLYLATMADLPRTENSPPPTDQGTTDELARMTHDAVADYAHFLTEREAAALVAAYAKAATEPQVAAIVEVLPASTFSIKPPRATAPQAAPPAPVVAESATPAPVAKETPDERRARWLAMFEAEEKGEERGALQRVADRERVDRSNMGKGIAKARTERDNQKRAGAFTSQLVQCGKRKG